MKLNLSVAVAVMLLSNTCHAAPHLQPVPLPPVSEPAYTLAWGVYCNDNPGNPGEVFEYEKRAAAHAKADEMLDAYGTPDGCAHVELIRIEHPVPLVADGARAITDPCQPAIEAQLVPLGCRLTWRAAGWCANVRGVEFVWGVLFNEANERPLAVKGADGRLVLVGGSGPVSLRVQPRPAYVPPGAGVLPASLTVDLQSCQS